MRKRICELNCLPVNGKKKEKKVRGKKCTVTNCKSFWPSLSNRMELNNHLWSYWITWTREHWNLSSIRVDNTCLMPLQNKNCSILILYSSVRKYVYRFYIIFDNHFSQLRHQGSCPASAHLFMLQKSKRETHTTERSIHSKWNIIKDTGTSHAKCWFLGALWQGIYRCNISVNLLYFTLCSFNGWINLRFLLSLFLLGKENDVYVITRQYQEKCQLE